MMKKAYRIKKNHEFSAVFQQGKSYANRQFVLYVKEKTGQPHFRVGLTVSRKMGNAVTRNRIKRMLRELVRDLQAEIREDKDLIIIARKPVLDMKYEDLKKSMIHVMKRAAILKKNSVYVKRSFKHQRSK